MLCREAALWLEQVEGGIEPPPEVAEQLERTGLAARTAAATGERLEGAGLRERLRDVQSRRDGLKALLPTAGAEGPALRTEIAALDREEREVRTAILDAADRADTLDTKLVLAFRGRDLLGEIRSRLQRVGDLELSAFTSEMDGTRGALAAVASRGARILEAISPDSAWLEEVDVRAAAVGLASSGLAPAEAARRWLEAAKGLRNGLVPQTQHALVAEALATGPQPMNVTAFEQRVSATRHGFPSQDDATAAASLLWDAGADSATLAALADTLTSGWPAGVRAPAYLLCDADRRQDAPLVPALEQRIVAETGDDASTARWAAAFLALSPAPPEVAFTRFLEVRRWLARFGSDGMSAPASLLVQIDAEPAELLDDLRLASAAVRSAKLSLGALENLALGVKLLVQHALGASLPSVFPVARLPVRIVQAVSTFHVATVHRRVLFDEWHHPVHSHRVYG